MTAQSSALNPSWERRVLQKFSQLAVDLIEFKRPLEKNREPHGDSVVFKSRCLMLLSVTEASLKHSDVDFYLVDFYLLSPYSNSVALVIQQGALLGGAALNSRFPQKISHSREAV